MSTANSFKIDYFSTAYALTVAFGGIMGYAKSSSVPSLGAGLLFGSVLGYGAYQMSTNPANYHLSLGTSLVLGTMMGVRFYRTGKVMPAGIVAAISLMQVMRLGNRALNST